MEQDQETVCEIVRGEYFSGASEMAITIRKSMVKFSANCLNTLPDVNYILFAVYRLEKRLVIEPCSPECRDAVRWSSANPEKRKPKAVTCEEFYRRIRELMQWKEDCWYKIFGKLFDNGDGVSVIAFDLTSALIYRPNSDGKISREPEYPREWGNGFGMTVDEHYSNPLLRRFTKNVELALNTALETDSHNYDTENNNGSELLYSDAVQEHTTDAGKV